MNTSLQDFDMWGAADGEAHAVAAVFGTFASYFHDAPQETRAPGRLEALDRLAAALAGADQPGCGPGGDITAAFGRFAGRDLMAPLDVPPGLGPLDRSDLRPLARVRAERLRVNLRSGAPGLESVYSDGPNDGTFSARLAGLLRHPLHRARLWVGAGLPGGHGAGAAAELPAAAFHLAYLALHNRIVDALGLDDLPEAAFETARRLTRWHHQWLLLNAFAPAVCDPAVLALTLVRNAPLYGGFRQLHAPEAPELMPLPWEFTAAAFRAGPLARPGTARHRLRLGHRLNLASAQDCIAGLYVQADIEVEPLSAGELAEGPARAAVVGGGLLDRTPLWFYLMQEAALRGGGGRLGPLGSHLVAETLAGLVLHDPSSYWHQPGPGGEGRWRPEAVGGVTVDSLSALLALGGMA